MIMPNIYGCVFKKDSKISQPNVNGILPQSNVANGHSIIEKTPRGSGAPGGSKPHSSEAPSVALLQRYIYRSLRGEKLFCCQGEVKLDNLLMWRNVA